MSFTCQQCGTPQEAGVKPCKTVTIQRAKVYPRREEGEGYDHRVVDAGGTGTETVKEMDLCEKCAEKQSKKPVQAI